MLPHDIQACLIDTIKDHVQDGSTFTAWDITREARTMGFRVPHNEAKELIHNHFLAGNMPGYTRELRPVGPPGEVAWHYFPEPVTPAVAAHLAPSGLRTYPSTLLDDDDDRSPPPPSGGGIVRRRTNPLVKPRDARQRLLVPAWMTSRIGLSPGSLASLYREGGGKRLEVTTLTLGRPPWKRLFVRRCGGLYLSARDQRACGMIMSHRQIEIIGHALHITDHDGKVTPCS